MHLRKLTKQIPLFALIILGLLGCTTPYYYSINSFEDFPVYTIRGNRCIILNEQILNSNQPLFEKTIQLLKDRNYDELETFLANGNYPSNDVALCKTLICFSRGKYEEAQVHLANVTGFEYQCLVQLLKTDIEYEMKLSTGLISPNRFWEQVDPYERSKNRSELLKEYQEVFDCDSSEETHYMVKMRVKQLKYAK